ncbi:hypothetical protein SteCoe_17586 [Stentor coeruleus]|uniref:Uncharacterized protein n=1 Tax=Stentor coeruleus TaxID=5963 RepID=A0A1R2BZ14_9CILI|nr:hypothetical protein SteCoe_17586 [Stentor coeruleus]
MFLVYKNIPKATIDEMLHEQNGSKRKVLLENAIKTSYTGIHKDIFYEFHFGNLNFCLSNSFTSEKISCLLEIFKQVFDRSLSERLSESQSFDIFKSLLLKHSVQRSPRSIAVFTVPEVKKVVEFALVSFFRHFSLYTYAFLPNCNLSLKNVNRFEGVFPMILRLEEGAEIVPETIPALDEYIIKPVIEEPPRELDSEEEEALITDPLQYLLEKELKLIKTELDEKIKKQDEEFLAKIEVFKK